MSTTVSNYAALDWDILVKHINYVPKFQLKLETNLESIVSEKDDGEISITKSILLWIRINLNLTIIDGNHI
jgi:hypothetical protein